MTCFDLSVLLTAWANLITSITGLIAQMRRRRKGAADRRKTRFNLCMVRRALASARYGQLAHVKRGEPR